MNSPVLHHVSLVTLDLDRSIKFYRDVFGVKQIARPPFKSAGAWLAIGPQHSTSSSNRTEGDAINAILAAAGYNFCLLLTWLRLLMRREIDANPPTNVPRWISVKADKGTVRAQKVLTAQNERQRRYSLQCRNDIDQNQFVIRKIR